MIARDEHWMRHALSLAKRGEYTVRSNPLVGCVLVKEDGIVGEGLHWQRGGPHAEVHALLAAKEKARGATCYVTLEPCAHVGRTGPCVEALIEAGVKEVVMAVSDPNPLVAGKGKAALEAAGIPVREGVLSEEARAINKGFFSRMMRQRPYIRAKIGMSIDARVAMKSGESQWITSEQARKDVHQWRAKSGAILTTAQTVLKDDCRLTARDINITLPEGVYFSQPLRMIIDSHRQVSSDASIFKTSGEVVSAVLDTGVKPASYEKVFSADGTHVNLNEVFSWMAQNEINDVWVEAGPTFLGALLNAQWIDEWVIYIAPKWLGHEGLPMAYLPNLEKLSEHIAGRFDEVEKVGPDLRIVLLVR